MPSVRRKNIDITVHCGVYCLLQDKEVLYIGFSRDISGRVSIIRKQGLMFNKCWYIPVKDSYMSLANTLIKKYKPLYSDKLGGR